MSALDRVQGESIIDSRDVIEALAELDVEEDENLDEDEIELRDALRALDDEAPAEDWVYGAAMIREDYFEEYAQQLAEDIGAIDANASWPLSSIDWTAAAEALQQDYSTVEFLGHTYYVR
jgi:translation elongation factor EF-Tu-like GTPase